MSCTTLVFTGLTILLQRSSACVAALLGCAYCAGLGESWTGRVAAGLALLSVFLWFALLILRDFARRPRRYP